MYTTEQMLWNKDAGTSTDGYKCDWKTDYIKDNSKNLHIKNLELDTEKISGRNNPSLYNTSK